jgi:hypothetical protein
MGVKMCYLYAMGSRLVNVRLDEERLRKARRLRERGVTLSALVRDAIDERFEGNEALTPDEAKAIITRIYEQYPDPGEVPRRTYDVHDRRASRAAILRRLGRRSR